MSVNIDEELNIINTGVYGKDIRRAIHDALNKLAIAINQGGGGGGGGYSVYHFPTHNAYFNALANLEDIDPDDIAFIDSDKTIMSHAQRDPVTGEWIQHMDPETHELYVGELYGLLHVQPDPEEEDSGDES